MEVDDRPRFSVRVRVQDERGEGLAQRRVRLETPDDEHGGWYPLDSEVTGSLGEAEFVLDEDPEDLFEEFRTLRLTRSRWFAEDESHSLVVEDFRARTQFVFEELATGDLELVLHEGDGGSLMGVVQLTVYPAVGSAFEFQRISSIQSESRWSVLGMPLGMEFDVGVQRSTDTRRMEGQEQRFGSYVGPRYSGERVRHELVLDPPGLLLTGRAIGADGSPMARAEISMTLQPSAELGNLRRLRVTTEAGGEFRFAIPDAAALDRRVHRILMRAGTRGEWAAQHAPAHGPAGPVSSGVVHMGELHFDRGSSVVAGLVLDSEGRRASGVKITLQGRGRRSPGEEERWMDFEPRQYAWSGADGTFEWRGAWAPEAVRVLADLRQGGVRERAWRDDVRSGAGGLVLQLEPR